MSGFREVKSPYRNYAEHKIIFSKLKLTVLCAGKYFLHPTRVRNSG